MNILITGGAGFVGRDLARTLRQQGELALGSTARDAATQPIERITLFDQRAALDNLPANFLDESRLHARPGDIASAEDVRDAVQDADVIIHLAAVVSGGAEADFDLGMRVNLHGTLALLEACRALGAAKSTVPYFVFASSIAVFGGALPPVVEDDTATVPQSSYGIQKAAGELLVQDFSRKGFVDGRVLRLPTVVVRGGKPNKAASTFASSIIREPLQGRRAVCPVSPETAMWIGSPRRAVENIIHALRLPAEAFEDTIETGNVVTNRIVTLPGITVTIRQLVEALEKLAGPKVVERIDWQHDPFIDKLVQGWAARFNPARAQRLGFRGDESAEEIIRVFIADELAGEIVW